MWIVAVVISLTQAVWCSEPVVEAQALAIEGARILTMASAPIEVGTVLVRDGKIEAVGPDVVAPDGARRIDARGKTVIPGLIDSLSRLYAYPQELAESAKIAPQLRIIDGLDPYQVLAPEVLRYGVTAVHVTPGSRSHLGGLSAVVKVSASPGSLVTVADAAAVRGAIGIPDGGAISSLEKLESYTSIREALLAARDYVWSQEKYGRELARYEAKRKKAKKGDLPKRPAKPSIDPGREVLAQVLRRETPLQIEAHRVPDILNALRLADEFGLRLVLLGCSEGYKVADEIARRNVPVILGRWSMSVAKPSRLRYGDRSPACAARLSAAGVELAIGVGGSDGLHSKFVRTSASIAAANGLDRELALAAVTVDAARILGVAHRIGSIAEGRDADLVIIDGDPLDTRSVVETVLVDGKVVFERGASE